VVTVSLETSIRGFFLDEICKSKDFGTDKDNPSNRRENVRED
jgi:hypothetical protein